MAGSKARNIHKMLRGQGASSNEVLKSDKDKLRTDIQERGANQKAM